MDSLTQIVLGAAVAEAAAGKKMGNKAAMWGAMAGTIPDLDVFIRSFVHPIDGALMHRGFSHSIVFALLITPALAWILNRLYKKKYEYRTWSLLFFLSIITHPMLDIFTRYGTQFFWPFDVRLTFNSVFVIDPLYTLPFLLCILIVLFLKRESKLRRRLNYAGIIYSTLYLLWGVIVKLAIHYSSEDYFESAGIKTKNEKVITSPMPFTSFYWMMLTQDNENYYIGYKSLFYDFKVDDVETIKKNSHLIDSLKWNDTDYTNQIKFITKGFQPAEQVGDTIKVYDLRFGVGSMVTDGFYTKPVMGYGMVIDNGIVNKTVGVRPKGLWQYFNFETYLDKVFKE